MWLYKNEEKTFPPLKQRGEGFSSFLLEQHSQPFSRSGVVKSKTKQPPGPYMAPALPRAALLTRELGFVLHEQIQKHTRSS